MKIRTKLIIGFLIIISLMISVGVVAIVNLDKGNTEIKDLLNDKYRKTVVVNKIIYNVQEISRRIRNLALYTNPEVRRLQYDEAQKSLAQISPLINELERTITTEKGKALLDEVRTTRQEFVKHEKKALELGVGGRIDSLVPLIEGNLRQSQVDYIAALNKIIDYQDELMMESGENVQQLVSKTDNLIYILLAAGLIISIIVIVWVTNSIVAPIRSTISSAEGLAAGNLDIDMDSDRRDEAGELIRSMKSLATDLKGVNNDVVELVNAAINGSLNYRADAEKYKGQHKELVMGINGILDAISSPLNVTKDYLNRISQGDIPEKITENYKGDYNIIKESLNGLIDILKELEKETNTLIIASREGKLDVRANTENFEGNWKELVNGINDMLDEVLSPVYEASTILENIKGGNLRNRVTGDYKGQHLLLKESVNGVHEWLLGLIDYVSKIANGNLAAHIDKASDQDQIHEHLIRMRDNINALVLDARMLAKSAEDGKLSQRADLNAHNGEFRTIIGGVNNTLDAIVNPLNEAIEVIERMAEGDLTVEMKGEYKGDYNKLKFALNNSLASIDEILTSVRKTVEEVTNGAMQVSDASTALSQGATEQAASLEEITSSMSEIGSQTKNNAENANQANILTSESRKSAEKGNNEMQQLNSAMEDITDSSRNISKIIKVIDEIAFQTNLLALNAAVEAARAGRHGKGFAVVAEEVRNLAARSATAAKETSELIENSIKTVENGSLLAAKTAEALDEIKMSAVKAADIVGEIATLSNEQALGIAQINDGLQQIDKVTQTNTASAEESASASEELSGQASNLRKMIMRFTLRNTENDLHLRSTMISGRKENSKSLPEAKRELTSGNGIDDSNPEDIINLDDEDFGKY